MRPKATQTYRPDVQTQQNEAGDGKIKIVVWIADLPCLPIAAGGVNRQIFSRSFSISLRPFHFFVPWGKGSTIWLPRAVVDRMTSLGGWRSYAFCTGVNFLAVYCKICSSFASPPPRASPAPRAMDPNGARAGLVLDGATDCRRHCGQLVVGEINCRHGCQPSAAWASPNAIRFPAMCNTPSSFSTT